MHGQDLAHRNATWWLVAIVGCTLALALARPAISQAEESNPNNYSCLGQIGAGTPEVGSEEQQVRYTFYCNGPITGYELAAQIPLAGVEASPLVTAIPTGAPLSDTLSCSGEVPGYAANCVGATKAGKPLSAKGKHKGKKDKQDKKDKKGKAKKLAAKHAAKRS